MGTQNNELSVYALRRNAAARKVTEIIVHCSATPEGRNVGVKEIRRWHMEERGFRDIGYHFVIRLDGTVEVGRKLSQPGAHCVGHNRQSVGVCYVGGLNKGLKASDTRTFAQRDALKTLIGRLKQAFPQAVVYGHRDFASKACPCFEARKEYEFI